MTASSSFKNHRTLSFIGFGEAGKAFAKGIKGESPDLSVAAYDIKTSGDGTMQTAKWRDYEAEGVAGRKDCAELLAGERMVFCLVTADQAFLAAENTALNIASGTWYFEILWF